MREIIEADILRVRELLLDVFGTADYQCMERLGGLTNHTYKVSLKNNSSYVVRLPGEGTETLINRADEKISTSLACRLGIDARLLFFGEHGEKVAEFINGAKTLSPEAFASTHIAKKAAETLRILHTSGENTGVPFDVFDMAAGYERIIADNCVALFNDYKEIKKEIMLIRDGMHAYHVPDVPCHNDPLCENWVLDCAGRLYLIDWEYAGMNDAMWDLADVSIEAGFTKEQDEAFLALYCGKTPEYAELLRFFANKLYLDYLWSLWGKARVPFDGDLMEQYAAERFARLKQNLTAFKRQFGTGA